MRKTNFGIKIDSMHDCSIQDGTFYAYFDLRSSKDDLGRPLKNYLGFSFETVIDRITFIRYSEDVDGDSVHEDVSSRLPIRTKSQIILKTAPMYRQLVNSLRAESL